MVWKHVFLEENLKAQCVYKHWFFFKVKTQSWNESPPPPSLLGMIYNLKKKSEKKKWDKNEVSYRLDNRILIFQWNQIKCSN